MKVPSEAQAALLALVQEHEDAGASVEWEIDQAARGSRAHLVIERIDRVRNASSFEVADGGTWRHRVVTVRSCLRYGWLDAPHERTVTWRPGWHGTHQAASSSITASRLAHGVGCTE